MSSTWEHFFAATAILASPGPIKARLAQAFRVHLADLNEDQLPQEIQEEFSSVSHRMSGVRPMRGETTFDAPVRKMSDAEAGHIAMRIVNMLGVISRLQTQQRPKLRAVNSGDD